MPCDVSRRGRKLQKAILKINKKLGLNDREVILQRPIALDPSQYDPDVSDVPEYDDLTWETVYTFPPAGGCTIEPLSTFFIMKSNGQFQKDDLRITFPGGLKDQYGDVIPESILRKIRKVLVGSTEAELQYVEYDVIKPPSPLKDAFFLGTVIEWEIIIRLTHGDRDGQNVY